MDRKKGIAQNIAGVQARIDLAAKAAGRSPQDVTLIAVSKTQPISAIQEAYEAGVRDFGENRVQEFLEKYEHLPEDIRWHIIGHLQSNKVKYVVGKVHLIHSVDSFELAQTISKQAVKSGVTQAILLQVNVAREETKFGMSPSETRAITSEIISLPNIAVKGFMTVAPFVTDAEQNRVFFSTLAQLVVDIGKKTTDNECISELSMGMTGDYEVAVMEGATYLRVGTGIFGER
jgi:pyridoxal phosphate enzyme (YggS family)